MDDRSLSQKTCTLICKNCGASLSQDSVFCVNCGTKVEISPAQHVPLLEANPIVQPQISADPPPQKVSSLTPQKLGALLLGTALIAIGITRILSAGTTISSTSFGGDFYTYTYRGIVAITEQLAAIQVSLGWVIAAVGAAIDVYVLHK